jgi:hypothetical protein
MNNRGKGGLTNCIRTALNRPRPTLLLSCCLPLDVTILTAPSMCDRHASSPTSLCAVKLCQTCQPRPNHCRPAPSRRLTSYKISNNTAASVPSLRNVAGSCKLSNVFCSALLSSLSASAAQSCRFAFRLFPSAAAAHALKACRSAESLPSLSSIGSRYSMYPTAVPPIRGTRMKFAAK